ncbi:MAG: hypothetical protein FJ272_21980, partial [Planctomycetes bacterium]|nr:hypothetical protein [Planctomycetota bacterium]
NLMAFGERLIADSGYYQSFGDEHHYGWTVTTPAHNTILIGGKGQASRNVDAFGQIVDFQVGDGFVRAVGSCPNAYHNVKIERFDRHVLWLQPNVFLIADDLKTAGPQQFQWLLHSAEQMRVSGGTVELAVGKAEGRLTFFEPSALKFEQTDKFAVPVEGWRPDRKNRDYPDQWHLTASTVTPATAQRFISVIQVCRKGEAGKLPKVEAQQDARGATLTLAGGRKGRIEWRSE